jgi:hypothetical protein
VCGGLHILPPATPFDCLEGMCVWYLLVSSSLPHLRFGCPPLSHPLDGQQPWTYVDFVVYLRLKHASGVVLTGVEDTVWRALRSGTPTAWLPVQQVGAFRTPS